MSVPAPAVTLSGIVNDAERVTTLTEEELEAMPEYEKPTTAAQPSGSANAGRRARSPVAGRFGAVTHSSPQQPGRGTSAASPRFGPPHATARASMPAMV